MTRAVSPVREGRIERAGVGIAFQVWGAGEPTVFLLMPNVIVQSRAWKAQVPFLSRSFRVVTADPRGNGASDRPTDPDAYAVREVVDDAWAVLDEVGAGEAVLCGVCSGASVALVMAAERPERVLGVVALNPSLPLRPPHPWMLRYDFEAELAVTEAACAGDGWARLTRQSWLRDWPGFARFFFEQLFPEPHSTKQVEDGVGWATGSSAEVMLADHDGPMSGHGTEQAARRVCAAVRCPVLVVTGTEDRCQPPGRGAVVADLTGAEHVVIEGAGHLPMARDPVFVNLLLRDFVRRASSAEGPEGPRSPGSSGVSLSGRAGRGLGGPPGRRRPDHR